eukprot:CAMPEP_0183311526 /NCGR_PEP_ID=MMETSP0160_2-20130417/37443_1 /TAXON_ID=2839 ORGANISM="Odontella Sinensis, Strain Grunow 1884" /NCGR_SAMPLE_ID=MMETSP0160_2 /ASSEMBLY_ACC=CAM_ASM_000250 /LENGTH=137 /DNA_ID=CAMNT_0025476137 /DNA_START=170 /DNA_END=583 /DNA_ORIENTATION=-
MEIKLETKKLTKNIVKYGRKPNEITESIHGIEVCREKVFQRRRRKDDVCNAVLAEQEEQRRMGINVPLRIAALSMYYSKLSRREALDAVNSDAIISRSPRHRNIMMAGHDLRKLVKESEQSRVGTKRIYSLGNKYIY